MEDIFLPLRRYARFRGRSRGRELWAYFLFLLLGMVALRIADSTLGLDSSGRGIPGGILTMSFLLVNLLPTLAVSSRRLHDTGRSGWMTILAVIPMFGLAYLLYLFSQPGQKGPNEHGPDPRHPVTADIFA